ncbi:MAG: phosphatase PAP2 family protein [Planctomycetota bacterium]
MRVYRIDGLWIRLFCVALVFAAGCASQTTKAPEQNTQAQSEPASQQAEPEQSARNEKERDPNEALWWRSIKEDVRKWPNRIKGDVKETFLRPDNATALLLAAGASIAMHNSDADDNIKEHFDKHSTLDGFADESLNIIGHPWTHFGADVLWYVLSAENEDDLNRQRAWTMRTALSINWVTTMGLKLARNNRTPNGKRFAWPSGHTSSSFTVASVLDEFYGPKVGIPAYIVAAAVGWRMMDTGDHWASDVVFGATLGWVVGHTVAGRHKKLEIAGFDVVPYVDQTQESKIGVGFLKRF